MGWSVGAGLWELGYGAWAVAWAVGRALAWAVAWAQWAGAQAGAQACGLARRKQAVYTTSSANSLPIALSGRRMFNVVS